MFWNRPNQFQVETLFKNEHANSINGYVPLRHAYEKEDKSKLFVS